MITLAVAMVGVYLAEPSSTTLEPRLGTSGSASAVERDRVTILHVCRDCDSGKVPAGGNAEFTEIPLKNGFSKVDLRPQ